VSTAVLNPRTGKNETHVVLYVLPTTELPVSSVVGTKKADGTLAGGVDAAAVMQGTCRSYFVPPIEAPTKPACDGSGSLVPLYTALTAVQSSPVVAYALNDARMLAIGKLTLRSQALAKQGFINQTASASLGTYVRTMALLAAVEDVDLTNAAMEAADALNGKRLSAAAVTALLDRDGYVDDAFARPAPRSHADALKKLGRDAGRDVIPLLGAMAACTGSGEMSEMYRVPVKWDQGGDEGGEAAASATGAATSATDAASAVETPTPVASLTAYLNRSSTDGASGSVNATTRCNPLYKGHISAFVCGTTDAFRVPACNLTTLMDTSALPTTAPRPVQTDGAQAQTWDCALYRQHTRILSAIEGVVAQIRTNAGGVLKAAAKAAAEPNAPRADLEAALAPMFVEPVVIGIDFEDWLGGAQGVKALLAQSADYTVVDGLEPPPSKDIALTFCPPPPPPPVDIIRGVMVLMVVVASLSLVGFIVWWKVGSPLVFDICRSYWRRQARKKRVLERETRKSMELLMDPKNRETGDGKGGEGAGGVVPLPRDVDQEDDGGVDVVSGSDDDGGGGGSGGSGGENVNEDSGSGGEGSGGSGSGSEEDVSGSDGDGGKEEELAELDGET
jgi:hypothetical protein